MAIKKILKQFGFFSWCVFDLEHIMRASTLAKTCKCIWDDRLVSI